jgi:hypothetical protein
MHFYLGPEFVQALRPAQETGQLQINPAVSTCERESASEGRATLLSQIAFRFSSVILATATNKWIRRIIYACF